MSDINLINNPGIQGPKKNDDNKSSPPVDDGSCYYPIENSNVRVNNNKKIYKYFFVLVSFFIAIIFIINFYDDSNVMELGMKDQQSFLLMDIINILDDNQENINISLISFKKKQLSINFKCINEKSFYSLFDSFSNIIKYNIKGYHIQNNYALNIELPWKIKSNKNFNIDSLNKELMDLGLDLKQEIYKNKLIIVSNLDKIIKLINLIYEINLIDNFYIEIRQISSLPNNMNLYQAIIE